MTRRLFALVPVAAEAAMRHVHYPQYYLWFVLLAALDVMATWVVLHMGGREANAFANWVLQRWQLPGMVLLKFAAVVLVVIICEYIGTQRPKTGLRVIQITHHNNNEWGGGKIEKTWTGHTKLGHEGDERLNALY